MKKSTNIAVMALLIAIIASLWASLSSYLGLLTAPGALICAGIFVANGSVIANAPKITFGFLAGIVWSYVVVKVLGALEAALTLDPHVILFLTLFVFAFVAVIISCYLNKIFDLASWLSGWALALTIMLSPGTISLETWLLHLAIAVVCGVWLIGVLITVLHKYFEGKFSAK